MKDPKITIIIAILLLIPSQLTGNNLIGNHLIISQLDTDYKPAIEKIVSLLEEYADYEGSQLLGWYFRLNSSFESDQRMYRGYNAGLAGIGDFLLRVSQIGIHSHLLDEIVNHFLTNFGNDTDGIFWGRYVDGSTSGWLGMRYGSAGILRFLGNVYYNYNNSAIIKDVIDRAYSWLLAQEEDTGDWPISPENYITTGGEYGALGIVSSMLDLYELSSDAKYLNDARRVMDWLLSKGSWNENQFSIPWTPYGSGTEFDQLYVTGLGAGEAGIIRELIRLNELTGEYKSHAIGLGEHLVGLDLGGFWNSGSVSYITKLYTDNSGLTGYYVGSAGIASVLLELYDLSGENKFLTSAARAEKYIEHYIQGGSIAMGLGLESSYFTGLSKGSAGIALYYLQLYGRYQLSRHQSHAEAILSHLMDLINDGLIPVDEAQQPNLLGYSFNVDEGLAGVGDVLVDALQWESNPQKDDYENIYETITANFSRPAPVEETQPRYWLLIPVLSVVLLVLLLVYKKRETR